jgi:septal ring factor EnvC (AmiA/AmiB activator)
MIFSTEFRTAVDIASGAVITRPKEAGAQLFYSSLQVMKKVEEFMATGVRNHPSLTSAMVRFVMVMSHKSASGNDMTGMMNEFKAMKTEFSNVQKDLTGVQKEVKDLKKKNEYLQGQVDKIKRVGVEKGWKFTN